MIEYGLIAGPLVSGRPKSAIQGIKRFLKVFLQLGKLEPLRRRAAGATDRH